MHWSLKESSSLANRSTSWLPDYKIICSTHMLSASPIPRESYEYLRILCLRQRRQVDKFLLYHERWSNKVCNPTFLHMKFAVSEEQNIPWLLTAVFIRASRNELFLFIGSRKRFFKDPHATPLNKWSPLTFITLNQDGNLQITDLVKKTIYRKKVVINRTKK